MDRPGEAALGELREGGVFADAGREDASVRRADDARGEQRAAVAPARLGSRVTR